MEIYKTTSGLAFKKRIYDCIIFIINNISSILIDIRCYNNNLQLNCIKLCIYDVDIVMEKNAILKKLVELDYKIDKNRIFKKESSYFKTEENVFDIPTLKTLSSLVNKKIIVTLGGSISTGKEANVFYCQGYNQELAIKIYRINSNTFKTMNLYIINDIRFNNIKHSKKDIIFSWAQKEYQNLMRLYKLGINVPKPIIRDRNILIMSFIGYNKIAYPQLKELPLDSIFAESIFDTVIDSMRLMYQKASLVHSDLSEYNILFNPKTFKPFIIDVGQSVICSHPQSNVFLKRDITNILKFFKKYNITSDQKSIYNFITKNTSK